ncbi:MAG: ankyrin repeat domain-containing protein [Pseudomonadota bacterium]
MQITLSDPLAAAAVAIIDAGDVPALRHHLDQHPDLLSAVIDVGPERETGGYFAQPRLLWFVAENPIRTGRLPNNIAEVASTIINVARSARVPSLAEDIQTTLGLVASGRIARESGAQPGLIAMLVDAGANPAGAMQTALAHRETAAAEALLEAGAAVTLSTAAALGRIAALERALPTASPEERAEALMLAACNGQADSVRALGAAGTDPNRFLGPGLHAHTTPIHQAVYAGSLEIVMALVEVGADPTIRDRSFGGTALGWAEHCNQPEIAAWLRTL